LSIDSRWRRSRRSPTSASTTRICCSGLSPRPRRPGACDDRGAPLSRDVQGDALARARVRLAAAVIALIAAAVLLSYGIPPVPTWFYVFAWYPTLVALDQGVVLLGGESLLARPRDLVLMLWWSAVIWFLFEALNFRLQDWYYVFLPVRRLDRWLGITISLATVVPAVFLGERLLDRLGVWRDLRWRSVPLEPRHLPIVVGTGVGLLAAVLAFPR